MNQNRWLTVFGITLLILAFFAAGCSQQAAPAQVETPGEGEENGTEEVKKPASIMIAGSDSEVNLATRLAEEFMNENAHISIAVTGGGSGVGISSLIDGDIDIANSSRPMKDAELENHLTNQGEEAFAVRFATDGVAVVVNENNPVAELTVDQVGAIYRGDITNWSEVGGADQKITLYGRQSTSGTYVFFMELVVQADYSPEMRNLPGTSDIVEAVAGDIGGIGYAAIGYADRDGIKALSIAKDAGSTAYDPTVLENVTSSNYPLTRPLYQYLTGKPGGAILEFLLFETGDAGQNIVLDEGFYPITAADIEFNKKALE
jgi:phosphate transport system substrate-binding protein